MLSFARLHKTLDTLFSFARQRLQVQIASRLATKGRQLASKTLKLLSALVVEATERPKGNRPDVPALLIAVAHIHFNYVYLIVHHG